MVCGEATCDAPVPVPGESLPDGSRFFPLGPPVCIGCTLQLIFWYSLTNTFIFAPFDGSTNSFACFIHSY